MADSSLRSTWKSGRKGTLAPMEQAKVWGLIYVKKKLKYKISQSDMCKAVTKIGGGHPGQSAISKLEEIFDNDPSWYPGKASDDGDAPGPNPIFTSQCQQAVANSAMALKRSGFEPTAAAVKERCKIATWNPKTQEPFCDRLIYKVFRERCFDEDAGDPWDQRTPFNKTALSPPLVQMRLDWAKAQKKLKRSENWFFQNVIYIDPCNTILSDSLKIGFDENQASFGKAKRWMSSDSQRSARNLRASPYATKQARYGDKRVWWFIVLTRGKVAIMMMPDQWAQTGDGMAEFVAMLEPLLRKMVGTDARLPRVLLSDRGPGFYQASTGHIVEAYRKAVTDKGFRTYAGNDASKQAPDMPDIWPHETAVSWIRALMKKRPMTKGNGLVQMQKEFEAAMASSVKHINDNYDVASLCKSLPRRLDEVIAAKGERLKH